VVLSKKILTREMKTGARKWCHQLWGLVLFLLGFFAA